MEAYLDNAATTQTFPEVCDIVKRVMMTDFGNPSSKHTKGMEAENYINEAKENIKMRQQQMPAKRDCIYIGRNRVKQYGSHRHCYGK